MGIHNMLFKYIIIIYRLKLYVGILYTKNTTDLSTVHSLNISSDCNVNT